MVSKRAEVPAKRRIFELGGFEFEIQVNRQDEMLRADVRLTVEPHEISQRMTWRELADFVEWLNQTTAAIAPNQEEVI